MSASKAAILNSDAPIITSGKRQSAYSHDEPIDCGHGGLFGPGNAQLPLPPMLMFDRVTLIADEGGKYDRGIVQAELDIDPALWFLPAILTTIQ